MAVRKKLMTMSELHHGMLHFIFGLLAVAVVYIVNRHPASLTVFDLTSMTIIAIFGSFLPDIDHLFYIFWYGRKSEYSFVSRNFLLKRHLRDFIKYVSKNHKGNTGIYSHNLGSVLLAGFAAKYFIHHPDDAYWATFFTSWFFHYIYDIIEDLLFFSKLNKNWFFRFDLKNKTQLKA